MVSLRTRVDKKPGQHSVVSASVSLFETGHAGGRAKFTFELTKFEGPTEHDGSAEGDMENQLGVSELRRRSCSDVGRLRISGCARWRLQADAWEHARRTARREK